MGNNRPDLGTNPICNRFTGFLEEGQPLFLPCNPPMPGAFVSVHLESPNPNQLSICEAFVYTDQALPIERCPQFRDQPPGTNFLLNRKQHELKPPLFFVILRQYRYVQRKVLHLLQSPTSQIPRCVIILSCQRRHSSRWKQSSPSRIHKLGTVEETSQRLQRAVLDGCRQRSPDPCLEMVKGRRCYSFLLELARRQWRLCQIRWYQRLVVVRHRLPDAS